MTEYIERDALLDNISAAVKHRGMGEIIGKALMRYVKRQPAADVAPVTRCKDCKHSWEDISGLCCSHGVCVDLTVPGDFYCAYGERKP